MSSQKAPMRLHNREQPKLSQPREPSTDTPIPETDTIIKFVDDEYDPQHFNNLARTVADKIKANTPKDEFEEDIKYQLTYRGKERTSLRKNLEKEANLDTKEKILESTCVRDLAGVRILTYFPDDVPKIAETITKLFDVVRKPFIQHSKMNCLDPRRPEDDAALEGDEDHANRVFQRYPNGMWTTNHNKDIVRIWKNAGYRAVHFHINGADEKTPEVPPQNAGDAPPRDASGPPPPPPPRDADIALPPIPDLWRKRVEVQITTIVMHAWSEVQHDLIYKNVYQLPHNAIIDRMVDGTNGLAITSEILLQQLQQTFTSLRSYEEGKFTDAGDLKAWIFEQYFGWGPEDNARWDKFHSLVNFVVPLLCSPVFSALDTKRKDVVKLLASCEHAPQDQTEILHSNENGFELLRNLLRNDHKDMMGEDCFKRKPPKFQLLHKFLLASSMCSIWVAISEWFARCYPSRLVSDESGLHFLKYKIPTFEEEIKCNRFEFKDMVEYISFINRVLMYQTLYESVPDDMLKTLEKFCDDYLDGVCCDEHEVAAKLAKLSFFLRSDRTLYDGQAENIPEKFVENHSLVPIDYEFLRYFEKELISAKPVSRQWSLPEPWSFEGPYFEYTNCLSIPSSESRHYIRQPGNPSFMYWKFSSDPIDFRQSKENVQSWMLDWISPETVEVHLQGILEGHADMEEE